MIDPKLQYCGCGWSFIPSIFFRMRLLLFGDSVKRCPRCGAVMKFHLCNHVVKVDTKVIRDKEQLYDVRRRF